MPVFCSHFFCMKTKVSCILLVAVFEALSCLPVTKLATKNGACGCCAACRYLPLSLHVIKGFENVFDVFAGAGDPGFFDAAWCCLRAFVV